MKRLMPAALLAFVLVIGNFVTLPWAPAQAPGCGNRNSGIFQSAPARCPMPWWHQGSTTLA
jgi:hypothetical protein